MYITLKIEKTQYFKDENYLVFKFKGVVKFFSSIV